MWYGPTHTHYSTALVSPQTAQHHPGCTENPADVTLPPMSPAWQQWGNLAGLDCMIQQCLK